MADNDNTFLNANNIYEEVEGEVGKNLLLEETQQSNLVGLIKQGYPDIRKILNSIQKANINGKFTIDHKVDNNDIINVIHKHIGSKTVLKLRKYLIENENEFQGDYHNLMKQYLNYVYDSSLDDNKKRQYIVTISESMVNDVWVLDKEINAFACWVKLERI